MLFRSDAALQVGALATATLHTQLHQLANAFLVEGVERVGGDDLLFDIVLHDVNAIVKDYIEEKIIPADPFNTLDQEGVGQLVKLGVQRGRSQRANLKCGVCGEHGGDPASVHFFYKAGLNYVSCSPFRVPVARLAAAQAAIEEERAK